MNKNYDRYYSHSDPGFIPYYILHIEREKNVPLVVKDLLFHGIYMKCFHFYKKYLHSYLSSFFVLDFEFRRIIVYSYFNATVMSCKKIET